MKILDDFEYERPRSRAEALSLLAKHKEAASPLAGGTDLVVGMKYRSMLQLVEGAGTAGARFPAARRVPPIHRPKVVISLALLEELRGVERKGKTVRVGPCSTMTELSEEPSVLRDLPALADAAKIMGSPLIRNRATIGGNLINGRPAADTAIAAMALGGELELSSEDNVRKVAVDGFFQGPGKTVRGANELLTCVQFSVGKGQGSAYERQGTRRQLEISLASAAAWMHLDETDGSIREARIAMGAVGPVPISASKAADMLRGRQPSAELFKNAARLARDEAKPIDDFRGSADYRRQIIEVLVTRSLTRAWERARA